MSPPVSGRLRSNSSGASLHSRSRTSVAPSTAASPHKSSPRTSKASPGRPSVRVNTFTAATTVNSSSGSSKLAPTHTRLPASTAALPRVARLAQPSVSVSNSTPHTGNTSASPSLSASTPQHTDTIHASQLLLAAHSSSDHPEPSQSSVAGVSSYSHAVLLQASDRTATDDGEERSTRTTSRVSQSSHTSAQDEEEGDDKIEQKVDNNGAAQSASLAPSLLRNGFGQVLTKDRAEEICAKQADLVCAVSLPVMPASPTTPKVTAQLRLKERDERKGSGSSDCEETEAACHPFQPSANKEDGDVAMPLSMPATKPSPLIPSQTLPHALLQLQTAAVPGSVSVSAISTSRSPTHSVNRPLHHSGTLSPHAGSTSTTNQRRSNNSGGIGSALPRLPFLASPSSSSTAVATAAGPEGFLASLNPHVASPRASHSAADPLLSHDAVTATTQHRSPSVVVRSTRPFSLHRANKHSTLPAEAKRANFFASVAHALGRMSVTQTAADWSGGDGGPGGLGCASAVVVVAVG